MIHRQFGEEDRSKVRDVDYVSALSFHQFLRVANGGVAVVLDRLDHNIFDERTSDAVGFAVYFVVSLAAVATSLWIFS